MALSFVSDTRRRVPFGNRWKVYGTVDEVTNSGDTVSASAVGLSSIESVQATAEEDTVSVQAVRNSNDGTLGTSAGALYLKTSAGTHDVYVEIVGR